MSFRPEPILGPQCQNTLKRNLLSQHRFARIVAISIGSARPTLQERSKGGAVPCRPRTPHLVGPAEKQSAPRPKPRSRSTFGDCGRRKLELSQPQCTTLPAVKRIGSRQKHTTPLAIVDVTRFFGSGAV